MTSFVVALPGLKRLHQLNVNEKFGARKGVYNSNNRAIKVLNPQEAFYRCSYYDEDGICEWDYKWIDERFRYKEWYTKRVNLPQDGLFVKTNSNPRYCSHPDMCGYDIGCEGAGDEWAFLAKNLMFEIMDLETQELYWLPTNSWVHPYKFKTIVGEFIQHLKN